ncbi:MAG: DUF2141 domain-containing protein [Porphyrobacter sp.]|nr:DUF2141 domain-containing protein [Porphyrobacter sp.]
MNAIPAVAALPLLAAAMIPSSPDLGVAEGRCRPSEPGPALLVSVEGLKDRKGNLKLEVYPANDHDFLEDDNVLVSRGKVFRRVDVPVPESGPVELCIRVPSPGPYTVSLLHDRDGNRKFGWMVDGIGFAGNPKLGWGKPRASAATAVAGDGLTRLPIVLNYRHGLGVAPIRKR